MTNKTNSPDAPSAETKSAESADRIQVVNKSKRYINIPIAKGVKKTLGTELDAHMVKKGKGHPHKVRLTQAEYSYAMSKKGVQGLFDSGELQIVLRA